MKPIPDDGSGRSDEGAYRSPAVADANRDLLFGLITLQNGMIDQSQLVAAFQAWTLEKDRPLADYLAAR